MLRTLPAAVAATGVVAATTLCCSDTSAPTRAAAPRTALVASSAASAPTLTPQQSGTTNRLQAISPVSPRVAWASGVGGTYVVTTDGGATWRAGVVPAVLGLVDARRGAAAGRHQVRVRLAHPLDVPKLEPLGPGDDAGPPCRAAVGGDDVRPPHATRPGHPWTDRTDRLQPIRRAALLRRQRGRGGGGARDQGGTRGRGAGGRRGIRAAQGRGGDHAGRRDSSGESTQHGDVSGRSEISRTGSQN